MYSNASAASRTRRNSVMTVYRRNAARSSDDSVSRMLQNNLDDDVARIPAAVDRLLHHLIKLLEDHQLFCVVRPMVEILKQDEHHLVGFALGELQSVVGLADFFDGGAAAQLFHHEG